MNHWIGTSGFQYPEWKGKFYPEKLPVGKMLPYYAEHFSSTEINYTFRRIPMEKTIAGWSQATPAAFRFSYKAPQRITHFTRLQGNAEIIAAFRRAIFAAEDKAGVVLFQLPPNFTKDLAVLKDFLAELPRDLRVAFEFRHESWFDDRVFETLRAANAALCIAESADLATPPIATANFGYLRLRREDYTARQIEHWSDWLQEHDSEWKEAFIYFKHEDCAVGPKFAAQMQKFLHRPTTTTRSSR